jgi:excisionase family DNA binding protein
MNMRLYTINQVAEMLQLHPNTVSKLKYRIGYIRVGGSIRFSQEQIDAYIAGQSSTPGGNINPLSLRVVKDEICQSPKTPRLVSGKLTSNFQAARELESLLRQPIVRKRRSYTTS